MKFILLIFVISSYTISAKSLDFESIQHSQITIKRHISSVFRTGKYVYGMPSFGDYIIRSDYNDAPGPDGYAFGDKYSDTAGTIRIQLPSYARKGYWNAIAEQSQGLMVLEGHRKRMVAYNTATKKFSEVTDIILDLFRPAADSRGEATKAEIARNRSLFLKRLNQFDDTKIVLSGITKLPKKWTGYSDETYLVATRLKGFNLFMMTCNQREGLVCMFRRSCFVEGSSSFDSLDLSGLAISEKRRQVLMVDTSLSKILYFKWNSCHHIPFRGKISVPKKLKGPRSLMVDIDDNLWLSTQKPDDYRNASVYKWLAKDW